MAGFPRFLAVLRLFGEEVSSLTVPEISAALGAPASTVYRTVRDLVDAGFLEAGRAGEYRLGPAFIEYDRLLRLNDPLVAAGLGAMREVVKQAGVPCVGKLARLYNNQVICVADEASGETSAMGSYERGKPMPLTRGATSKAILAHLPSRRLSRLLAEMKLHEGAHYADLRKELADIRRCGYCATANEIDPGLAGIAAPVMSREAGVVASLSLVVEEAMLDDSRRNRLVLLVVSAASLITEDMNRRLARPPIPHPAEMDA